MLEEGPAGAAALVLVSCKPNSMILVRFPNPLAPGNMSVGKPNSIILVFHIGISVWLIQATATALVQALRDRRLEDTTKSEFVIKISLKSSIALTLRLEPFLAGGHRARWVLGDERIWQRKVIDLLGNQRISSFCAQLFHNCCKAGRVVNHPFSG